MTPKMPKLIELIDEPGLFIEGAFFAVFVFKPLANTVLSLELGYQFG